MRKIFEKKNGDENKLLIFLFAVAVWLIVSALLTHYFPKPKGMTDDEYLVKRMQGR